MVVTSSSEVQKISSNKLIALVLRIECTKYSYVDLKELFKKAKTKEEQDFYIALSEIVLQKEQERVIGKN